MVGFPCQGKPRHEGVYGSGASLPKLAPCARCPDVSADRAGMWHRDGNVHPQQGMISVLSQELPQLGCKKGEELGEIWSMLFTVLFLHRDCTSLLMLGSLEFSISTKSGFCFCFCFCFLSIRWTIWLDKSLCMSFYFSIRDQGFHSIYYVAGLPPLLLYRFSPYPHQKLGGQWDSPTGESHSTNTSEWDQTHWCFFLLS